MRIIAIDPGTSCGYAWSDDGNVHVAQSGVWDLKPRRHEGGGMRYLRVKRYIKELCELQPLVAVFYEEVRGHKGTDAAHIYGGIVAVIAAHCEENAIPYQGIPVGTIKKRATGKGNANKQAMIDAANARFALNPHPGLNEPSIKDDNQADALWILQCGIDELGVRVSVESVEG